MKTIFKHLDEVCSALYQDKSDKDLVLLAQDGNKKAILELINRYRPLIISYGRRQHTLALGKEEVIQELILLFIQAIKAYHVKGTVPFARSLPSNMAIGTSFTRFAVYGNTKYCPFSRPSMEVKLILVSK